ncbi:peptidoglycan-binding domain-containing protein [Defluviimonas sp. SAOS-178_SWC]|uniref:peptidoglycan-binding domain-containing protein n=1 Tax=Defluviimonas sp. SAOS-178_SWC TaxID=3121287 RepID=UPI003221C660
MLPTIRKTATAAIAALSLAAAVPAHAWGEKEQNALAALAVAGVVGTLLYKDRQRKQATVSRQYVAPRYQQPAPTYRALVYQEPAYREPARYQPEQSSGIYTTSAARAFNSYTQEERRRIQSRLAGAGYYHGSIDGAFGPMTYRAIMAIAGDSTGTDQVSTMRGAFEFYDTLLG